MSSIKKNEVGSWDVWLTRIGAPIGRPMPFLLQPYEEDEGEFIDCFSSLLEAAEALIEASNRQQKEELENYRERIELLEKEADAGQVRSMLANTKGEELIETIEAIGEREAAKNHTPRHTFREIRHFYAVAAKRGLNPKRKAAVRVALGCFFDCEFRHLSDVSASQWKQAAGAVKVGGLQW